MKIQKKIKGQISIFLALVFMVIFTLFATTLSVGMFVHDKINLQNATDLASYYVATKQAEMLGAIAHSNYQIRQAYKLMAFRYRVFSNAARTREGSDLSTNVRHPGNIADYQSYYGLEEIYRPANYDKSSASGVHYPPRVCIATPFLFSDITSDNQCKQINFSVNYLKKITQYTPGTIIGINPGIDTANKKIANSCEVASYLNWWFSNTIVASFRLEQRDRRAVIQALAENLSQPIAPGGMKDLDGKDVFEGARKTFLYNLTESNREGLDLGAIPSISFTNSLSGIDIKKWLVPIYFNPVLAYSDFNTTGSGCSENLRPHFEIEGRDEALNDPVTGQGARDFRDKLDNDDLLRQVNPVNKNPDDLLNLTRGVEKNPWYMVYNKAQASAYSRPVFLLRAFGQQGVQMQAVAYAKPFGGRIGPWNQALWPKGSEASSAPPSKQALDSVAVTRVSEAQISGNNVQLDNELAYPNYARFPGDEKGLITYSSMVFAGPMIGWDRNKTLTNPPPARTTDFKYSTYSYFLGGEYNDPLAQNSVANSPAGKTDSFYRRMEIAAIAPDIFDVTYYSISPGFYDYYIEDKANGIERLKSWLPSRLPQHVQLRGDIGGYSSNDLINFDIEDQKNINKEVQSKDNSYGWQATVSRSNQKVPWLYNPGKVAHLSAWNSGQEVMDYGDAASSGLSDRFASCATSLNRSDLKDKVRIPSECTRGGRTGYSVKLISRDYLEAEHPIGGDGITGTIENIVN